MIKAVLVLLLFSGLASQSYARRKSTCARKTCKEGYKCIETKPKFFQFPCFIRPKCVPTEKPKDTCATRKCEKGYKCTELISLCNRPPCPDYGIHTACLPTEKPKDSCATRKCEKGYKCTEITILCNGPPCPDSETHTECEPTGDTCAEMKCGRHKTCVQPAYECTDSSCRVKKPACIDNGLLYSIEQMRYKSCVDLKCPENHTCVQAAYQCKGPLCYPPNAECVRNRDVDPCIGHSCPEGKVCRAEQKTICGLRPPWTACHKIGPKVAKCVEPSETENEHQGALLN